MYQLILMVHVFVAIFVIMLVLVQQGKGATAGAAFGSGASQTVFGSRGSGSFLFRLTISFVAVFFITSIMLNYWVASSYKHEKSDVTLPVIPVKPLAPAPTSAAPLVPSPELQIPSAPMKIDLPVETPKKE